MLALFDHDYLGTHFLLQVWDHRHQADPDLHWQYVLALHSNRRDGTGWTTRIVAEYGYDCLMQAAQHVDQWLKTPECLRFMLE